jgi:large subunit ribosomal protein L29
MILKSKDLREKSIKDLQEELKGLRKQLFESKMSNYSRNLENISSLREFKKSIARILTILKQKKQEEALSA